MKLRQPISYLFFCVLVSIQSCIEPFEFSSESFEKVLVVEATITNESKYHQIKLSQAGKIDDTSFFPEQNASVKIVDEFANVINFNEVTPGTYISGIAFKAEPNTGYQLSITTNGGKSYKSTYIPLTDESEIDALYPERVTDAVGEESVAIYLDSHSISGNSNYYRYEYEETFKIIAPNWRDVELVVSSFGQREIVDKSVINDRVCYNTSYSNSIIQTATNELTEDKVLKFPVIALYTDNPKISHRYSLLVRQYVQSRDANNYFKLLGGLEEGGSLFSENQPGFVPSNIVSEQDSREKVIGYFEVNSVSEKRVFFNYDDFFPNEELPPYFIDCESFTLPYRGLNQAVNNREVLYFDDYVPPSPPEPGADAPYYFVKPPCGDCRIIGSNIKPDFWED